MCCYWLSRDDVILEVFYRDLGRYLVTMTSYVTFHLPAFFLSPGAQRNFEYASDFGSIIPCYDVDRWLLDFATSAFILVVNPSSLDISLVLWAVQSLAFPHPLPVLLESSVKFSAHLGSSDANQVPADKTSREIQHQSQILPQ